MFELKGRTALITGAGVTLYGACKAAAVYLASEESSWVTGQLLPVNGGISPA